mgnify:CR=1 FL=1
MSSAQYLTVEGPVETVSNRAAGMCEIVAPCVLRVRPPHAP